jgi:hypothetical protein
MKLRLTPLGPILIFAACLTPALHAWDYEGHRIVNQIALAALPREFPAFVREPANAERIAFLAGEPDRWRNVPDLPLQQFNGMDHYIDLEEIPLAGLTFEQVSPLRYEFALQFAAGRAAHPENFPAIDPARNADHSREWCGFSPWAITEYYGKLRAAFSYLKVMEELGTAEETANARANIVYLMGVMGHYVGDDAQPLHTTIHHHGWVGPNPNGYTTWTGIHGWIDGGLMAKAGIRFPDLQSRVTTAQPISFAPTGDARDPLFVAVLHYVIAQQKLVEPLYALEKAGKLGQAPDQMVSPEGRSFVEARLLTGGEELAAIWVTAWKAAIPDNYLRASLLKRQGLPVPPRP